MKKFLILIILFSSCSMESPARKKTKDIELRQLVNTTEVESHGSGGLFFASYTSGENDYIKMFAKIDGFYRFLEVYMGDVRIAIRNDVSKPYIYFTYMDSDSLSTVEAIDDYSSKCVIVCPEKYLPEKLLPIEIKK